MNLGYTLNWKNIEYTCVFPQDNVQEYALINFNENEIPAFHHNNIILFNDSGIWKQEIEIIGEMKLVNEEDYDTEMIDFVNKPCFKSVKLFKKINKEY